MPLYDLFHKPLSDLHQWMSFHSQWASCISADLNRRLPRRFLAEGPYSLGTFASADVAEVDQSPMGGNGTPFSGASGGGVGVLTEPVTYIPPATDLVMTADFPAEVLVEIRDLHHARQVLAVVELVSPGNKDDEEAREAFAGKCLSYLAKGLGLVVIDNVTSRLANLHNVLVRMTAHDAKFEMAGGPSTYAVAYRPVRRKHENFVDIWHWPLAVGSALPTVPLALKGFGCVALNLEATYAEACERSRIP